MGKKFGGWCLLVLGVGFVLLGGLLFIAAFIETGSKFRMFLNSVIIVSVGLSLGRYGWQLRGPI